MAGIYIHIPFCKKACHYCDFHFSVNTEHKALLVESIKKEAVLQKDYLNKASVNSIYFGGGTPSLLSAKEIEAIIHSVYQNYTIEKDIEITLEANPDDLTSHYLSALQQTGINRLSIGIQSFDESQLSFLNRAHNRKQAVDCIENARQLNFNNISVDLIYGIPAKNHALWEQSIDAVLSFSPEHISAYCLTIEARTVFGKLVRDNKMPPVDDDFANAQYFYLVEQLEQSGYQQYEISNFSKPGKTSRHNSKYWKDEVYLGLGPSAHSYNGNSRKFNISSNKGYIDAINQRIIPCTTEKLSLSDKVNERILTTLRTTWGCDTKKINHDFGVNLSEIHNKSISEYVENNKIMVEEGIIRLTPQGKLFADKIASDLFID